jgi:hypothetical protein
MTATITIFTDTRYQDVRIAFEEHSQKKSIVTNILVENQQAEIAYLMKEHQFAQYGSTILGALLIVLAGIMAVRYVLHGHLTN